MFSNRVTSEQLPLLVEFGLFCVCVCVCGDFGGKRSGRHSVKLLSGFMLGSCRAFKKYSGEKTSRGGGNQAEDGVGEVSVHSRNMGRGRDEGRGS